VVEAQDGECGCDDPADSPRVQADVAERFEGHFEDGVAAFADGS
jgi:hypothetical protein